ncbi:transposase domain-containing protein [Agrobacterium tumefaciens]|uniref:transposase domain-containing protein n=1 Tax=Agrobacterium tumefaciens TaxID=358 RepID=UPI00045A6888|nr:transposase domain-containing protein [Agrobacterium tumefaciens]CDN93455.1 Mu transposase [Agrobacterium tumefaciens]
MKKEWFTSAELAQAALPGVPSSRQGLELFIARSGVRSTAKARTKAGQGGGFEYHYSFLPAVAQAKLAFLNAEPSDPRPTKLSKMLWDRFEALSDAHKAICKTRLGVLTEIAELRAAGLQTVKAIEFCARKASVSPRTVYNWMESVEGHSRQDWLAALAPSFSGSGTGEAAEVAPCHPEAWKILKSDFLRPERPSFSACYRRMMMVARDQNLSPVPSERSLRRRLDAEVPKAAQIIAREGKDKAKQLFPAQKRTVAHLHAMEIVNTDGHQLDLFVRAPWSETPVRVILIGIQDVYSRKVLSWTLAEAETWEAVRTCIGSMIENHDGMLPYHIYMDNGRAFAGKMISGGAKTRHRFKVNEDDVAGLLKTLDIEPHFVKPRSGQSKPIERAWRDLAEEISKHPSMSGCYTGNKPDAKPENYGNSAVRLETLQRHVAQCVDEHNHRLNRTTETAHGRSFAQTFDASIAEPSTIVRYASMAQRSLWMLSAVAITARKPDGAIHMHGNRYWNAVLNEWIGKKLTVRFDPADLYKPVKVYDPEGRFLCDADCLAKTGFADTDAARRQEKARKTHVKNLQAVAKSNAALSPMQLGEIMEKGRKAEAAKRPQTPVRPVVTRLVTGNLAHAPVEAVSVDHFEDSFARGLARVAGGESAIIQFPTGNNEAGNKPARKRRAEK